MSFGSSSHVYAHSLPCIHKSCECAETSDSKVTATARLHKSYIPTIVPEANVASSACVFAGLGVAAIAYCFFIPSTTRGLKYLNPRVLSRVGSEMVLGPL